MSHAEAANVISLHPAAPAAAETCRVPPIVAKWVRQADEDCLKASAALRDAAPAMHARIAAGEHKLRELLQRYAQAHRDHVALGLHGFHAPMSKPAYWLALVLAALLEAPANRHALSFMAMDNGSTVALAVFLALFNVVGASIAGRMLRQCSARPQREWAVMGAVALVAFAVMLALAGLRDDYIAHVAAQDAMPTSGWTLSGLLWLQALFFVVGAALAFQMVPPDARLQRVLADKAQLRQRIDALLRQRTALAERHDRLWLQAQRAVAQRRARCLALVGEYVDENLSARRGSAAPAWMRHGLDASVFTPIDLGQPLLDTMPALDSLIQMAENNTK